ncbi:unnamed protein product [Moneuplotes crassus]|uniref:Uncharacterized protein n=1 Tax=Euplotes crassus TaxID=5936 RepID=A0AAD1Y8J2_EUPCR|nr:unnamed protein product [Moneuplotes crassus]
MILKSKSSCSSIILCSSSLTSSLEWIIEKYLRDHPAKVLIPKVKSISVPDLISPRFCVELAYTISKMPSWSSLSNISATDSCNSVVRSWKIVIASSSSCCSPILSWSSWLLATHSGWSKVSTSQTKPNSFHWLFTVTSSYSIQTSWKSPTQV